MRIREARTARGWSAEELARRCAELGTRRLDRSTITSIEIGRREKVSVDELLILSAALSVAPVNLLAPISETIEQAGREVPVYVRITPDFWLHPSVMREWVRGRQPVLGKRTDPRIYFREVAPEDWKETTELFASGGSMTERARKLQVPAEVKAALGIDRRGKPRPGTVREKDE